MKKVLLILSFLLCLNVFAEVPPATKDRPNPIDINTEITKENINENKHTLAIVNFIEKSQSYKNNIKPMSIYHTAKYYAEKYDIDVDILIALMRKESNFYQGSISNKNCRGICQISWGAWDRYDTVKWKEIGKLKYTWNDMLTRYDKNIDVACWYLTWLWENFDNITNTRELLIAYNVGPYDLNKYKKVSANYYHYADDIIRWTRQIKEAYK